MILCARRADALQSVASACASAHKESGLKQGGKFAVVQLDVSDKAQVSALWDKVPQDLRTVDILGGWYLKLLCGCVYLRYDLLCIRFS